MLHIEMFQKHFPAKIWNLPVCNSFQEDKWTHIKKKKRSPHGACTMRWKSFSVSNRYSWMVSSDKTEAVPYWWQNNSHMNDQCYVYAQHKIPQEARKGKKFTQSWKWNMAVNSCWCEVQRIAIRGVVAEIRCECVLIEARLLTRSCITRN